MAIILLIFLFQNMVFILIRHRNDTETYNRSFSSCTRVHSFWHVLILAFSIPAREPFWEGECLCVIGKEQEGNRIQAHVKERQVPYMHTGAGPSLTSAKRRRAAESFRHLLHLLLNARSMPCLLESGDCPVWEQPQCCRKMMPGDEKENWSIACNTAEGDGWKKNEASRSLQSSMLG